MNTQPTLTGRIARAAHAADSQSSLRSLSSPRPSQLKSHRPSIFHKNSIAFAPNTKTLPSDIDAIANLPAPHQLRYRSKSITHAPHPWINTPSLQSISLDPETESHSGFRSSDDFERSQGSHRTGKIQLPPPYKKHRAVIEGRRAKRDFIYGRDEDYEFSETDNKVKATCCGVLYFHIMELLDLIVNRQSFVDSVPVSYYCNLSIGQIKRTTKIVHSYDSHLVKIDSGMHLAIEVSEARHAPSNRLCLELWSFQDPEAHFIVGTCEIHIYHLIRLQHLIDYSHLWSDGICVGKLAFEAAFSYGTFGYGHSNQLMNFSQPLMETISHSMFPRIKLDETSDMSDNFQARKPDNLKMFTYHSFILEMDDLVDPHIAAMFAHKRTEPNIKLEPKQMTVQQVDFMDGFPVHCKLHMNIYQTPLQADFNDMYGEYICLGHKRERLEYLTNMVQGRMRDMHHLETGPLFQHLDERELDRIHRTHTVPGEILYPKKYPCPSSQPYKLTMEDEQFQSQFPAVRRESGFLGGLFGYNETPPEGSFLNDMNYPAYQDAKLPQLKNVTVENCCMHFVAWLKKTFLRLQAFSFKLWGFIFPEITHDLVIPQISVTVATPEGSTTNIYSYFSREGKDPKSKRKIDRLVQQTTALLSMTKKPLKKGKGKRVLSFPGKDPAGEGDEEDEDDSSSDNEDEIKLEEEVTQH